MTCEVRRFDVWGKCGTRFILVESAEYLSNESGGERTYIQSRFATLTGCLAKPSSKPGMYELPTLRMTLSDRKPSKRQAS